MAAPVIASLSGVNFTATSGSAARPAGTAQGDLLVFIASSDTASTVPTYAVGDFGGGTIHPLIAYDTSSYSGATTTYQAWWKIAGAAEPASYALGVSVSRLTGFHVLRITGHDMADPFDAVTSAANHSGSASEPAAPALTTSVGEALVIRSVAWDESKTLLAGPGGHATASHLDVSGHDQIVHTLTQALAGTVAAAGYDLSSGTRWIAASLAIRPPQGGGAAGAGAVALSLAADGAGARGAGGVGAGLLTLAAAGAGDAQVAIAAVGQAVLAVGGAGAAGRGTAATGAASLNLAAAGWGRIADDWFPAGPAAQPWSGQAGAGQAWSAGPAPTQPWAAAPAASGPWSHPPPAKETWT